MKEMDILKSIEKDLTLVNRTLNFEVGDTVKVHYKIIEGNRERVQVFEGIVIAIDNRGLGKNFTVRKLSFDIGVERIFPFYSPRIAKIEVMRKGKIRRAKLYFLRERTGKSSKLKERMRSSLKKHGLDIPSEGPVQEKSSAPEGTAENKAEKPEA
jgi:large subunit ribosomal protein L19